MIWSSLEKFRPGAGKTILIGLAGILWFMVSIMLCRLAVGWYSDFQGRGLFWYIFIGITGGLLVHHFGFLKIVNKNLARINSLDGKYCLFGFMPWKSYLLVAIMMTIGISMRNSSIDHIYLSVIYMAIGLALGLSSIRYFRNAIAKMSI